MPQLFSQKFHAYIDYPVAFGLIAMPFILGIGATNPIAMWLSVVTGVVAFILTFITDHETGVIKVLPYKFHLAVDFMVGAAFVVLPLVLGFKGLDLWYYLVLGVTVLAVVGLHKPSPALVVARA